MHAHHAIAWMDGWLLANRCACCAGAWQAGCCARRSNRHCCTLYHVAHSTCRTTRSSPTLAPPAPWAPPCWAACACEPLLPPVHDKTDCRVACKAGWVVAGLHAACWLTAACHRALLCPAGCAMCRAMAGRCCLRPLCSLPATCRPTLTWPVRCCLTHNAIAFTCRWKGLEDKLD